jgi:hypothetical protein
MSEERVPRVQVLSFWKRRRNSKHALNLAVQAFNSAFVSKPKQEMRQTVSAVLDVPPMECMVVWYGSAPAAGNL